MLSMFALIINSELVKLCHVRPSSSLLPPQLVHYRANSHHAAYNMVHSKLLQLTLVLSTTFRILHKLYNTRSFIKLKTSSCHLNVQFPADWDNTHTDNQWANEQTMSKYVQNIM